MLYAITPIFLTTVLGASASVVGLIEGVAESTASILKGLSGWYSDRIRNRKRFILAGYSLSALAKPLIAVAGSWLFVLFARFLDRLGKGIRSSSRDALIADVTAPEVRGHAYGYHRAMDTAGALLGVAISLYAINAYGDSGKQQILLRNLYWLAFIPALLGVIVIFFVREPRNENKRGGKSSKPLGELDRNYWKLVGAAALAYLGFSSNTFLILKARDSGMTLTQVLFAYLLYNICLAAAALPAGKLADRLRKELLIAAGLFVYAAVYFGFALAESRLEFMLLFVVYAFYSALTEGTFSALIANVVPPHVKATALGQFSMITGLLALAASLIAGWLWDNVSSDTPFYFGAVCAALAACAFLILSHRKPDAIPNTSARLF